MRELLSILAGPMPMGRLDRAALEIATLEYPSLDIEPWVRVLDRHAAALGPRVERNAPGTVYIEAANQYLFAEQGFAGATANYFDPRNSCLNDVLETRSGIPITLSVLYMEVARRLHRPVYGVGLPGHFLVRYDDGESAYFVDPFHGGAIRTAEECLELARKVGGEDISRDPTALATVNHRQILLRMLNNLRAVHVRRRNYPRALRVLDLLATAFPDAADVRKERGIVQAAMGNLNAARSELRHYLELAPRAEDRKQVEEQLVELHKRQAGWN